MTHTNFIQEDDDDWGNLTDPTTTDVTPVTTSPTSSSDNTSSSAPSLGFGGKAVRDAALNLVRDPNFLIPAGAAALGAGALFRTGQRIANVGSDEKKRRGPISRAFRTIVPLGLAGAAAYGGYRMMKNPVSENYNPYASALKPSSVLGGASALAAGLISFPTADALTSGIPNETVRTIANVGSKALLSTVGSALAGYGGWKAGKAIEDAEAARRKKEAQKNRNKYLPDFYYDNFA